MKPSNLVNSIGSHVLIYGEPGTGKSTLIYKLMLSGYKLWYLCLDGDVETPYKLGLPQEILDERLEIFLIPDTPDFPVAREVVRNVVKGVECFICDIHGQLNCLTCKRNTASFSRICLNEFGPKDILVIDHAGQIITSTFATIVKERKGSVEDYKMTQPDWGVMGMIMDTIYSNIQQSKANIIMVGHVVESEQEDGKKKLFPNIGTANFSRNAGKYFGHVIYLELINKTHRAASSTTYAISAIAKSRLDIAIEDMKEPSLVKFFDGSMSRRILPEHAVKAAAKVLETPSVKVEQEIIPEGKVLDAAKVAILTGGLHTLVGQPAVVSVKSTADSTADIKPVSNAVQTQQQTPTFANTAANTAPGMSIADKLKALKGNKTS